MLELSRTIEILENIKIIVLLIIVTMVENTVTFLCYIVENMLAGW